MLSGQGIAAQFQNAGSTPGNLTPCDMQAVTSVTPVLTSDNLLPPFLGDYLKAQYVKTQYVPVLIADTSGDVFAFGDSLIIQGMGGAANQTKPDLVLPINGGKGELTYLGQTTYGMISYTGIYRLLFLSFGFESIENGGGRWRDRDTVLTQIFDFFSYPLPGTIPRLDNTGNDEVRPFRSASETYKDSRATCTYAYQVYDDPELTSLVASDVGHPEGTGSTTSWQVPTPLTEDEDYYWRVRADQDGDTGVWSPPATFWVNADNQSPGEFSLISPADGDAVPDLQPTFIWRSSTDPDPYDSVVGYRLYYSTDPGFVSIDSVGGLTDTVHAMTSPIDIGEATTCYWMVAAFDACGGVTASQQVFQFRTVVMGDANGDGTINIGDAVFIINYIFKGGPAPEPEAAGDANCDGQVNIADPVYLIDYIFRGGPPPGCP